VQKGLGVKGVWSSSIVVRVADNAVDAQGLLPMYALGRLCAEPNPSAVRQNGIYLSNVIVALDGDAPVGFIAYRRTPGPIRVAHECWVDPDPRCGLALLLESLLTEFEASAKAAECSRLFVVVGQSARLRGIFEKSGYNISLAGGELTWFEKSLVTEGTPLDSA
jgi:hypothetical protein